MLWGAHVVCPSAGRGGGNTREQDSQLASKGAPSCVSISAAHVDDRAICNPWAAGTPMRRKPSLPIPDSIISGNFEIKKKKEIFFPWERQEAGSRKAEKWAVHSGLGLPWSGLLSTMLTGSRWREGDEWDSQLAALGLLQHWLQALLGSP